MKNTLLIFALIMSFLSCSQNESNEDLKPADLNLSKNDVQSSQNMFPTGIRYSYSEVAIQGAYNQFKQTLNKNEAISIIAEVDHSKNAKSIGEELDYTNLILFGNPVLGTPLMQRNQLAGLDLPQKVLFYKTDDKEDIIIYNSVAYLSSRHDLDGVETLPKVSEALENLVSGVSKSSVLESEDQMVSSGEGIETKESTFSFEETYSKLQNVLEENPNIRIIAELDHQENARSVGLDLKPTSIIIFGNPQLGTPLMLEEQSIGLDLPQKMLVWENAEGDVFVSYNNPYFIAERHDVDNSNEILAKIETALDNISNAATGN